MSQDITEDRNVSNLSRRAQAENFPATTKCPACKANSVLVGVEFSLTPKNQAYGFYRCTGYAAHVFELDEEDVCRKPSNVS